MKNYDSPTVIEASLQDLDLFHELLKARRDAGYERREHLTTFIVLGRFWLDGVGNCMKITEPFTWGYDHDLSFIAKGLPKVIREDILRAVLPEIHFGGSPFVIPKSSDLCVECGEGWTIDNLHDYTIVFRSGMSGPRTFLHQECCKLADERDTSEYYRKLAADAGLSRAVLIPIPNEYYKTDPSWQLLKTHRGDIKIGWRKRVINIDWSNAAERVYSTTPRSEASSLSRFLYSLSGETLFPTEEVTKGRYFVHAWTRDKAIEYLKTIAAVLKIKTVDAGAP
jgi:hypothetical protein